MPGHLTNPGEPEVGSLITLVLDRSASMRSIATETIDALNGFIDEQREVADGALVSLCEFNDQIEWRRNFKPMQTLDRFRRRDYVPTGGTALYDALGDSIAETWQRYVALDGLTLTYVVIVTDGEDNSSRHWSRFRLCDKIRDLRVRYGWEFIFLGANQDAVLQAERLAVPRRSALTYAGSCRGTRLALAAAGRAVRESRDGGSEVEITEEERAQQKLLMDGGG